jgi:hypothetical protein
MGEGEMRGVSVTYNLTDPARIAMGGRKELVNQVVELVRDIRTMQRSHS